MLDDKIYSKYKNETLEVEEFLESAVLCEVNQHAGTSELVKANVKIVNGAAHIDLVSNTPLVRTRVIVGDWNELTRFWGWFMGLPMVLYNGTTSNVYSIGVGRRIETFTMDGKIMPVKGTAFVN